MFLAWFARVTPAWLVTWAVVATASAQTAPIVDPQAFGFKIPPGPVSPGGGRCVLTDDRQGQPVVAQLHVEVGGHRIVMLPDGELVARANADAPLTDRAFQAISPEDLLARLTAGFGEQFKTRQTRNYVYIYNTSDEFALATSRILESMRPGVTSYVERMGIPVHEPEVPLVAIMFRTEPEFQSYERMAEGVVAYYHTLTNRIVMYEESPLLRVRRELGIQQAISTIAHEGVHQILHNIGVQQRLSAWPMWLSEGLAEYFAPTTFGSRLRWKGPGQVNDLRMLELELYIKGGQRERGSLVDHTVGAARLTSTGYASAWSLTHYLAKRHKQEFGAYVREVAKLQPLQTSGGIVEPGVIPANLALFKEHFGEDLVALETRLVEHLKKQPYRDPFADLPHFVATFAVRDGRRVIRDANVFHTEHMARLWLAELRDRLSPAQRGEAQARILEVDNRIIAEQVARQYLGR